MKLTKQEALNILNGENKDYQIIYDKIVDNSRWSLEYELVVYNIETKQYFKTYYGVGATETQDEGPWDYDDEVEFTEVFPVEKTAIEYVKKQ